MALSYLDITNQLLVRLTQPKLTTSTFANARGLHELAKNSVNDSIFHINDECEELNFMYKRDKVLSTTIGQTFYAFPASASKVDFDNMFVQADTSLSVGYAKLQLITHDLWKRNMQADDYNMPTTNYQVPAYVFQSPDDKIGFSRKPDKAYNILVNFWRFPVALESSTDVTDIPDRYIRIVVDGAEYYLHKMRKDAESRDAALEKFKSGLLKLRSLRVNRYTSMSDTRVVQTNSSSAGFIDA